MLRVHRMTVLLRLEVVVAVGLEKTVAQASPLVVVVVGIVAVDMTPGT